MQIDELRQARETSLPVACGRTKPDELRMLADALPVLIAHIDAQQRYRFNNRAYEKWFGVPSESLRGRTLCDVLGAETYEELLPRIQAALRGEPQLFEAPLTHRELGARIVQVHYVPKMNPAGSVDGIYVLIADVTEHRLAERRILGLVNTAHEGIWEMDARGNTLYLNARMAELLGASAAEMESKTFFDFIAPEDVSRAQAHWAQLMTGSPQAGEWRLRLKDGSLVWTTTCSSPVRGERDAVIGVLAMVTDITERKRAEEKILALNTDLERRVRERTSQLEATNNELEAFCYSVSHDLRAPLRAIRGFGEVLLDYYLPQLDERGQDFLRRTCEASEHMERLIEDLLKLSRVSRSELRAESVDLSRMAEEIVAELKKAEPARVVHFTAAPGLRARGDERLLRLVLENLLRNAWKFTGKRESATIEFGRAEGPDGEFYVRDDGAGFDMNYAGKLFGVFQRLHSTSDFPGSGVGLAIVQRIINRHGGRVWAVGQVDRGATVHFTLPVTAPS